MCADRRSLTGFLLAALLTTGLLGGCDQGPGGREEGRAPLVSGLDVRPDSVRTADLPVEDSLAEVALDLQVRAQDPDGTVERVVFTIEPAGNPRGTATGRLQEIEEHVFGGRIGLRVPAFIDEVYTVRVFAVDDDSLASNQALGRVRVIPDS